MIIRVPVADRPAAVVVLAAHGSRDPRSPATVRALARALGLRLGQPVVAAFLDFNLPAFGPAMRGLARQRPVVLPALLTHAYHGRVDVPAVLASVGVAATVAPVIGPAGPGYDPDPLLIAALLRRLSEVDGGGDGVVLLAAGTRDPVALSTVESVATALGQALGVPCVAGYASGAGRSGAAAAAAVRALGARHTAAASYFLAPGRLHEQVAASAASGGVRAVAPPLGTAPELVELLAHRAETATADAAALAGAGAAVIRSLR